MKQANDNYKFLHRWYSSPQGKRVGELFDQKLRPLHAILHGEKAIQIGDYPSLSLLNNVTYQHKWQIAPEAEAGATDLCADFTCLPIERHSINTIISPLSLDIYDVAAWPVDALDYILQPMGYLVIIGINPYSLWGAALKLGRLYCFPHSAHTLMPIFTLKNALHHRGYTQLHLEYFYFLPPVSSDRWLNRLAFLNQMGQMLPLSPAAFYLLVMKKYEPKPIDLRQGVLQRSMRPSSCF